MPISAFPAYLNSWSFLALYSATLPPPPFTRHRRRRRARLRCAHQSLRSSLSHSPLPRQWDCHFTGWRLYDTEVRLFANKYYFTGMSHIKNIREVKFGNRFVDTEYWNAIANSRIARRTFIRSVRIPGTTCRCWARGNGQGQGASSSGGLLHRGLPTYCGHRCSVPCHG